MMHDMTSILNANTKTWLYIVDGPCSKHLLNRWRDQWYLHVDLSDTFLWPWVCEWSHFQAHNYPITTKYWRGGVRRHWRHEFRVNCEHSAAFIFPNGNMLSCYHWSVHQPLLLRTEDRGVVFYRRSNARFADLQHISWVKCLFKKVYSAWALVFNSNAARAKLVRCP